MATVVIAGGRFDGQIDESELLIDADLRPNASVAGILGGTVVPSVVTEFPLFGDGVEDPEALARADIETAHISFVVAHALGRHALAERRADDDGVQCHHWRGLESDFAGG